MQPKKILISVHQYTAFVLTLIISLYREVCRRISIESAGYNVDTSPFGLMKEQLESPKLRRKQNKYLIYSKPTAISQSLNYMSSQPQLMWVYTVARYPANHDRLPLQQLLEAKNPQEFLSYVLEEHTLEERESLMLDEAQRRKTFLANWPLANNLSGIAMAKAGFYCLDDYDRVQCVFCRGSLHRWEAEDNPMREHARCFNFCRFVKGLECGNREYQAETLSYDDLRNVTIFDQKVLTKLYSNTNNSGDGSVSKPLGISMNRPSMKEYAPEVSRRKTFARWPHNCPINAQKMCAAGFYYTGFDDQVRCFHCAGGVQEWGDSDDPWEEHAKWFPDCAFVLQEKGEDYVDEVHARTSRDKKCLRKTSSKTKVVKRKLEDNGDQEQMKKICLRLGHSFQLIDRAMEDNGKPFDDISELIDVLYDLEDVGTGGDIVLLTPTGAQSALPQAEVRESHEPPSSEQQLKNELGCRNCEKKIDSFVPAAYVGLPCGHLVYCESCNTEEAQKSKDSRHKVFCPYKNCKTALTGTMKIYFA